MLTLSSQTMCGAILTSDTTHLTMTSDDTFCALLLSLFKFYKLVLRPYILHAPGFKELDVALGNNPQNVSKTQNVVYIL